MNWYKVKSGWIDWIRIFEVFFLEFVPSMGSHSPLSHVTDFPDGYLFLNVFFDNQKEDSFFYFTPPTTNLSVIMQIFSTIHADCIDAYKLRWIDLAKIDLNLNYYPKKIECNSFFSLIWSIAIQFLNW